jgi:hypothetical protein
MLLSSHINNGCGMEKVETGHIGISGVAAGKPRVDLLSLRKVRAQRQSGYDVINNYNIAIIRTDRPLRGKKHGAAYGVS